MKGKFCRSIIVMLAAVLGLSAGAYAVVNTIIITPDNEAAMGWTHYVTIFSDAPTQYPAACGFSVAPVGSQNAPGVGHGAFYGMTGNTQITDPPGQGMLDVGGQVYIGTNNYSGIKLSDITTLK